MTQILRPAVTLFLLLTLILGFAYPGISTAIIHALFPHQAQGSLIEKDGKILGSELIGQHVTGPNYFWGRPSATSPAYNAAASSGSNLGAANPALLDAVKERIKALKKADPNNTLPIPVDLVTASASGLDPHISPAAAEYQIPRVAKARRMKEETLRELVAAYTEPRQFGLLGEPRVHILKLNLALDEKP